MMKNVRLNLYPAIIITLGLTLLAMLFSQLKFSIEPAPTEPVASLPEPSPSIAPQPQPSPSSVVTAPSPVAPTPQPSPVTLPTTLRQGSLRISNQTDYPIRVALLPQQSLAGNIATKSSEPEQSQFGEPVHWDFAPEEGSSRGLRLSLPNGNLKIQEGDVVVAFAQDGSRRYWGPYIVGTTASPTWESTTTEWQLVLQP
jgi:cytoskeletal protein RodZ